MSNMDVVSFMEKNGREFFDSDQDQVSNPGETVEYTITIPILKAKLPEIRRHCRESGLAIEDFFADVIERWLHDS